MLFEPRPSVMINMHLRYYENTNTMVSLMTDQSKLEQQQHMREHQGHFKEQRRVDTSSSDSGCCTSPGSLDSQENSDGSKDSWQPSWLRSSGDGRGAHYQVPSNVPLSVSSSQQDDLQIVSKNVLRLKESGCYYPNMPQEEARRILKKLPEGHFLIRNSASPSYLFSLTVRTKKGPTSIRIKYHGGQFKLDSTTRQNLPSFESVMDLLEYYMGLSRPKALRGVCASIILDASGKKTQVKLSQPYLNQPMCLNHICRRTIFRHLPSTEEVTKLPLSDTDKAYMKKYTHKV